MLEPFIVGTYLIYLISAVLAILTIFESEPVTEPAVVKTAAEYAR